MSYALNRRALCVGAAAGALSACAPSASPEQHVNIYTSRHYDTDKAFHDAFTEHTGIQVRVLQASGDQLIERLRIEGDQSEADLIVTVDAGNLFRLQEAQLLQPVTTPALESAMPARLHEPTGLWWGFAKRARVIAYRKDAVDAATLTSMDDLATARFRGQVCARSSSNVYNLSLLASRIARLGADNARAWAQGVHANFARDPQGGDIEQLRAIAAGEGSVAITNHYYYVRLAKSEDPADQQVANAVGLIFPDQAGAGTHVNISGAGVATHTKRRDNAIALLEFLVSREAQLQVAPLNTEYPIRTDVEPTPELAAYLPFKEEDVPLIALGQHQAEAAHIFEEVGWR